jgi:hypothetical protein
MRVNPGLELVNAFRVHVRDSQPSLITQGCHCPFQKQGRLNRQNFSRGVFLAPELQFVKP